MDSPHVKTKTEVIGGRKVKFIDSYWTFAVAVAFLGPFALPLFWRNPRASLRAKVVVTAVVGLATALLLWVSGKAVGTSYDQYKQLQQMLNSGGGS